MNMLPGNAVLTMQCFDFLSMFLALFVRSNRNSSTSWVDFKSSELSLFDIIVDRSSKISSILPVNSYMISSNSAIRLTYLQLLMIDKRIEYHFSMGQDGPNF